jgi:protoporphyrinogen oxidase
MENDVIALPSRTGMYFNGRMWKLSTPMDLLRFTPLSIIDRIRLGLLVILVRRIKDWHIIEHLTIREWLEPLCGKNVFKVVWEPLISSKFSRYADTVSAVWMWKKLVLRGGTRNDKGGEELVYFKGGFGRLAEKIVTSIREAGGDVRFNTKITGVNSENNRLLSLKAGNEEIAGEQFLFTPAFPVIADIFENQASSDWLMKLRRVNYLGNLCLVLRLNRSLSDTYWLNVNDPGFPFVGVIEHTNFDAPENYRGTHMVYLSRYMSDTDPLWNSSEEDYFIYALKHLKRMFPEMHSSWVLEYKVWRADYAQPVTEINYSKYVPGAETPFENVLISTMAQIYPEDRGTNYAIREGRNIARKLLQERVPHHEASKHMHPGSVKYRGSTS